MTYVYGFPTSCYCSCILKQIQQEERMGGRETKTDE